jgi:hypothetical protein
LNRPLIDLPLSPGALGQHTLERLVDLPALVEVGSVWSHAGLDPEAFPHERLEGRYLLVGHAHGFLLDR